MKNIYIKVITGFREDQYQVIDSEEAHKAYYLFLNPEERGVFNNGVALVGKDIQQIVPDYNRTMGWNPTHILDSDDWNEIRAMEVDKKMNEVLSYAKQVANLGKVYINNTLSSVVHLIPEKEKTLPDTASIVDKMRLK